MKRLFVIFLLFVFLPHKGLAGCGDPSFLSNLVLKLIDTTSAPFSALSDLMEGVPLVRIALPPVKHDDSFVTRFAALESFPIADVVAAPGHRFLREPEKVTGLIQHIQETQGGQFSHDKILLNIITDENDEVLSVDLWNAHHRLVAYMEAGYKFLGDIPAENFEILVNGYPCYGKAWEHYLPYAATDVLTHNVDFYEVPLRAGVEPGSIAVAGNVSNYRVGSRSTLRALHLVTMAKQKPRVAVFFGAFDPLTQRDLEMANLAIQKEHIDEVLFVPSVDLLKKNGKTLKQRMSAIAKSIKNLSKVNLYVGDSAELLNWGGLAPFMERVGQIYGTKDIYQIFYPTTFAVALKNGEINQSMSHRALVFSSDAENVIIPSELREKVLLVK